MNITDYLSSCKRYFLEVTASPYPGHLGKCLWAPVGSNPGWKKLELLEPGDCIIHYITLRAKNNPHKTCFIGISKVANKAIEITKEELKSKLKEMKIWNRKYEEFSKKWMDYNYFYFVELTDYHEFPIKVKLSVIPSINPVQEYIQFIDTDTARRILSYAWQEEKEILRVLFDNMVKIKKQKLSERDKKDLDKLKNTIYSISNEFRREDLNKDKVIGLIDSLKNLKKVSSWLWTTYSTPKKEIPIDTLIDEFLLSPKYRSLFRKVSQIESYDEILKFYEDLKDAILKLPSDIRVVVFTSWLFVVNPKFFALISGEFLWDRVQGSEIKRFKDILWGVLTIGGNRTRDWFWDYYQESKIDEILKKYFIYNEVLYNIARDNDLNDMIDVMYLIGKCIRDKECLSAALSGFDKEIFQATEDKRIYLHREICSDIMPDIEKIKSILYDKGQVILYGPPGVGKTFLALNYVKCANDNIVDSAMITFHQSYSYEEFIEGFRPVKSGDGKTISYEVVDGIFKRMAIKATWEFFKAICQTHNQENEVCREMFEFMSNTDQESDKENYKEIKYHILKILGKLSRNESLREEFYKLYNENRSNIPKYILIIDEINRGDISRIFGELITLIEDDKRLFMENQIIATLPYSGECFAVPPNLYIIGTMNSTDRSIALVDFALRRRFAFIEIEPDPNKLKDKSIDGLNLSELLRKLNDKIMEKLDRDHRIGHSYFLNIRDKKSLWNVWFYEIVPLLVEYFYGRLHVLSDIFGEAKNDLLNCSDNNICYPKSPSEVSEDALVEALKKLIKKNEQTTG